jgi:hypothetical protein
MIRLPGHRLPLGSRGLYVRAYCGLFSPRTLDMLAVRIGPLAP